MGIRRRILHCSLVAVLLCSAGISPAQGCLCEYNWKADYRPQHQGCTAVPIQVGTPSYTGSTPLYRHHDASFSKSASTDVDCLQRADCSFEDVAEDLFICNWEIEKSTGGLFHLERSMAGNCAEATWTTTALSQPDMWYRAKVYVSDTPWDGPYGDDPTVNKTSGIVKLEAPGVAGQEHRIRKTRQPTGNFCILAASTVKSYMRALVGSIALRSTGTPVRIAFS